METIEQLLQRGNQAQGGGVTQALLSAPEAEQIINQLTPLSIEEVGSAKWHTQHEWIERLNLQAHYNAQTHSDEFVVELLVSLDKLHVLVHDLLVIEAWKEFVFPLLSAHLAERVDSVTGYLLLYHEVTVANLLQVALYHSHAAESLSEDTALEVADWCYRKLTALNTEGHKLAEHRERTTEELLGMSRQEELQDKRQEVEFSVMMCSLAILRYVTDALPRLPMGALSRVVSTNDTLMGLLPLLDRPPWVRTRVPPGGGRPVLEKWAGNRWAPVAPADRLKITQTDGQVWLAVTNLLVEPRCRAKYSLDEYRRERILGLKRHLNELMFDQLPVLKDLQRVLDELALGVLPDQGAAGKSALILEAVPVIRERLLRGRNWRQVAEQAKKEHFGRAAAELARERMEALVKNLDFLCELEPEPPGGPQAGSADTASRGGTGSAPEPHPPVKVSTWRKVHDSGVYEAWYDFRMEVDESRDPEPVEVAAPAAGAGPSSSGGRAGESVQGLRYRLRPLDLEGTRPLPANGKAVVRWGSLSAEALLQLPELPTRDSEEGAAVLWVTVGLLAVDGVVLQVKLKKAPKPKERDRVAGVWYAYHPVAGALTVLRTQQPQPAAPGKCPAEGKAAAAAAAAIQPVTAKTANGATGGAARSAVAAGEATGPKDAVKHAAGGDGKGSEKPATRPLVQVLTDVPPPATIAAASPSPPAAPTRAAPEPATAMPSAAATTDAGPRPEVVVAPGGVSPDADRSVSTSGGNAITAMEGLYARTGETTAHGATEVADGRPQPQEPGASLSAETAHQSLSSAPVAAISRSEMSVGAPVVVPAAGPRSAVAAPAASDSAPDDDEEGAGLDDPE